MTAGLARQAAFACLSKTNRIITQQCTTTTTPTTLPLSPFDVGDFVTNSHHAISHLWDTVASSSSQILADVTTATAPSIDIPPLLDEAANGLSTIFEDIRTEPQLSPQLEEMSLSALGHDLLLFLLAAVVVDPLGKILGVTPVLLYLILGFVAGPYGLSLFQSGTEVNSEIGDYGILFLLFVEGLNLSPERLKALGSFFSLGATQLLFSVGFIFFGLFIGGPYLLPIVQDVRVPIDPNLFELLEKPVIAFSIASAGALSSSAFVLPILKEKGWEKRSDGIATLSILLLQDLAVAPLLVILPLIANEYNDKPPTLLTNAADSIITTATTTTSQDPTGLSLLVAKATLGFGGVLALASVLLRRIFQIVARFGSAQTFIAASLLVAAGMGIIADKLGLSATTGAFAAGVLLAESGYRAQIEADIKPFEGILLGVFFVTAGASLDPQIVIEQWPALVAGVSAFIVVKFGIVLAASEFALGLTFADSTRVAFLLAGGGEFAFVVFKLADNLGVLPENLAKLLTASVIISMSLTPLLGELAVWSGNLIDEAEVKRQRQLRASRLGLAPGATNNNGDNIINGFSIDGALIDDESDYDVNLTSDSRIREAFEAFDADGSGSISVKELKKVLTKPGTTNVSLSDDEIKAVISRFDVNGDGELQFDEFTALWTAKRRTAIQQFGATSITTMEDDTQTITTIQQQPGRKRSTSSDPATVASTEKALEKAVVVCGYGEVAQQLCAQLEDIPYVAFSQNPGRISLGVLNGASVVYGNGASPSLVRAVGIEEPSAIVVAYATEARCLEATLRLHEAFPRTPIYVRTDRLANVDQLMKAGATKVVVETRKVAEAFGKLVGLEGAIKERMTEAVASLRPGEVIPYSESELTELAYVCDMSPVELAQLYDLFQTSINRDVDGKVQLAELRDELMRRRTTPLDDDTLKTWMGYDEFLSKWVTTPAEVKWVTFAEFVRFAAGKL